MTEPTIYAATAIGFSWPTGPLPGNGAVRHIFRGKRERLLGQSESHMMSECGLRLYSLLIDWRPALQAGLNQQPLCEECDAIDRGEVWAGK